MTQHICYGEWIEGTVAGCPEHNHDGRGMINRTGYTETTRTYRVDGPPESNNYQREHFSGRLDAKVNANPVVLGGDVARAVAKRLSK